VGLLKALGAARAQVRALFLTEALLLAGGGTLVGLALAFGTVHLVNAWFDDFRLVVPAWAPAAAAAVSLGAGLIFGLLPALRAARLDPVRALTGR
jgi:putative ABC transport system permease protein